MPNTWVVAADSTQAEIYLVEKIGAPFKRVKDLANAEGQLKGRDLTTDRPGRSFDSMGAGRHAMSATESPREHVADGFARDICQFLESARSRGRYDRLIVVAPPDFLGRLRKAITPAANQLVVESVPKNLVGVDGNAIRERLETYL
jgi:protein required for attachment to host cells